MKRLKMKWSRVVSRLVLGILVLSLYQAPLNASGIIASTKALEKQNIENIKNSAKALSETAKQVKDDIQKYGKSLKSSPQSSIDGLMDKLSGVLGEELDCESLLTLDRTEIKKVFDNAKSLVDDSSSEGQALIASLNTMETQTQELVQNAKNIITLRYTTPVGIRSSQLMFDLGVDTLYYERLSAEKGSVGMDIHATWTLPWTVADGKEETTLSFVGKDVILRGEGTSKIMMANPDQHNDNECFRLTLSKDKIYLDVFYDSYVEIDCSGFKKMYLHGRVCFASDIMTNAKNPKDEVTASFHATFEDLRNIIFEAQIDQPFKLKATDNVIYTGYGLVADFSTKENGKTFAFPKYYECPFAPEYEACWTGFAIKKLEVDLTEEFPDFPLDVIGANNMLIDETGVSGWFYASASFGQNNSQSTNSTTSTNTTTQATTANIGSTNLGTANANQGNSQSGTTPGSATSSTSSTKAAGESNSTIEAKFDEIGIGLSHSKIVAGSLGGSVTIKPLKDSKNQPLVLALKGTISRADSSKHMNFDISATIAKDLKYKLPILETTWVTVGQGTSISYSKTHNTKVENGENIETIDREFLLNLNGGLDVDNKLVKIEGMKFERLQFSSQKPHFRKGNFSLNSIDSPALHGLPFGLKSVTAYNRDSDAVLCPEVYLSLISKDNDKDAKQGVSVDAAFNLVAGIDEKGKFDWYIKGLELKKIDIDINYSAFRLRGLIEGYKDEPMYGDGFHGALEFKLETPPIAAQAETYFGKTNYIDGEQTTAKKYRYWYAYANVDMPPNTLIFPPAVFLSSVSLSVYNRLRYDYDDDECRISNVYPDKSKGFGFKAGVGVCVAQDNLINAKVTMGLDFSSSGGISNVNLNGRVGVLGKNGMDKTFLEGKIACKYDFENSIFSLDTKVYPGPSISNYLDGEAYIKVRAYPKSWYCNIGTVEDPNYLSFKGIATAKSYMMFGDSVPTYLPPLDPAISNFFNASQSTATSSDHSEDLGGGKGFAFGIGLSVESHLSAFVYADLVFKGGMDVLVVRKPQMQCGDSKYRASGRVYVYLAGAAGIKFRKKKFEIVGFDAAADLEGQVPKPIFVQGRVAFEFRLLGGMVKGKARAKYQTGTTCEWAPDGTSKYVGYDHVNTDEEEVQNGERGAIEVENPSDYKIDTNDGN